MDKTKFLNVALAIGKVISTDVADRARVLVQLNRFNPWINTYFAQTESLETYNPKDHAKVGDIVLIKKMDEVRRIVETHKISEVIYSAGFIVDPMTGLRVDKNRYIFENEVDEQSVQDLYITIKDKEYSPKYSFELESSNVVKPQKTDT